MILLQCDGLSRRFQELAMASSVVQAKVRTSQTQPSRVPEASVIVQRLPAEQPRRTAAPGAGGLPWSFTRIPVHSQTEPTIQPKLTISTPGDRGEQEADRVAEAVMRMPDPQAGGSLARIQTGGTATVQRLCQECEQESTQEELQGKGSGADVEEVEGRVASDLQAMRGSGSPLPDSSRAFFEPRLGQDLTAVRIHTDSRAAQVARSLHARAFTLGREIVFGSGEYAPGTQAGKHLLAHELAHVVQQSRAEPQIQRLTVTQHALTKRTCGGRNVQWVFSLDNPAPEDGYIVQQVDRNEWVATCPDKAYGPPAPLPTFWEAWFVKKGDKLDWTTVRDNWTDGSTSASRPGTNGQYIAAGTIKFFTKSTTGDLGDFGKAPTDPKSPWGPGKVPISGALPSTSSSPSWWSSGPTEGPASRGVWASWDCCDADPAKQTHDLTVKP
jgi:hypothetical protein